MLSQGCNTHARTNVLFIAVLAEQPCLTQSQMGPSIGNLPLQAIAVLAICVLYVLPVHYLCMTMPDLMLMATTEQSVRIVI